MIVSKHAPRIVTASELVEVVRLEDLLAPVERSLVAYSEDKVEAAPMLLFRLPGGEAHVKAAVMAGAPFWSLKAIASVPANIRRGLPAAHATLTLFDVETGRPEAVILDHGGLLTGLRTAAAGALAARLLAPPTATLLVVGTGLQARLQPQAFALVRPFRRLLVWGRSDAAAGHAAASLREALPEVEVGVAGDLRRAVADATSIITATASEEPLLFGEWLEAGQHVTAVGADTIDKRELDATALLRADRLYVDSRELNLQVGEIAAAVEARALTRDDITGELGSLASKPTIRRDDEVTVAKLVGIGVQDLAAATAVLEPLGEAASAGDAEWTP
jgi:ornithine cyclodeaminase/alanine dehydrogenase-like protein (mu-crystallin family)